jgi:hypothetical protein
MPFNVNNNMQDAFYICQSLLFGVLGGGVFRFVKELRGLRERPAAQEHNEGRASFSVSPPR